MKKLPNIEELKQGYLEFAKFTFYLLTKATTDERYFKFAAVNAQVSLELFLKYVFTREGKAHEIQKKKDGALTEDFVDFSQILSHAFNEKIIVGVEKRELYNLLTARNSIVHRSQGHDIEQQLAEIISICFLLIHHISWIRFGDSLLFQSMGVHPISKNEAWVTGIKKFVARLSGEFSVSPVNCIHCDNKSLVSGEIVTLDSFQNEEDVVCLCCLTSMNTDFDINLLLCPLCDEKSYFVDILNPQKHQSFVGGCSTCGHREWVRKCAQCENIYLPSFTEEASKSGKIFCSNFCKEVYFE